VPRLVGYEAAQALPKLPDTIWACVHITAATASSATRLVVVAQSPAAGTRVPAYGVRTADRGFKFTTVDLTVAAQP
jgi:hypothetical protein